MHCSDSHSARKTRRIVLWIFVISFIVFSVVAASSAKTSSFSYDNSVMDFLNHNPLLVITIGSALCLNFCVAPRESRLMLFTLYALFVIYATIASRLPSQGGFNFDIFWSYRQFYSDSSMRVEVLNNIWLFIPYGVGLYYSFHDSKAGILLFMLPVAIELVQGLFGFGLFEIDDIIGNTLGELIGIHVYCLMRLTKKHLHKRRYYRHHRSRDISIHVSEASRSRSASGI